MSRVFPVPAGANIIRLLPPSKKMSMGMMMPLFGG